MPIKLSTSYSPVQFSIVRIILGLYLTQYFIRLIPHGTLLFSEQGMISDITLNYTYPFTFWFIEHFTHPLSVTTLLIALTILAILFTLGIHRKIVAALLWCGWVILFNLNNLTNDPSLAFIGLLLLVFAATSNGEPMLWNHRFLPADKNWEMSAIIYWGMWFVLCASFTISGLEKFASEMWRSGDALLTFYTGPIALSNQFVTWIITWPAGLHQALTWITLYSQVFAFAFLFFKRTRILFLITTIFLFAASLPVLDLMEVLVGMLIFYFFLFDINWFQTNTHLTVWIDDNCPICRTFAAGVKGEDINNRITILPFSDASLMEHLSHQEIIAMKEMVAYDGEHIFRGDKAVIKSLTHLGGIWICSYILYVIPKRIRRYIYRKIAKNRRCLGICSAT